MEEEFLTIADSLLDNAFFFLLFAILHSFLF